MTTRLLTYCTRNITFKVQTIIPPLRYITPNPHLLHIAFNITQFYASSHILEPMRNDEESEALIKQFKLLLNLIMKLYIDYVTLFRQKEAHSNTRTSDWRCRIQVYSSGDEDNYYNKFWAYSS